MQVSVSAVRDGMGGMSLRVGRVVGEVWFGSRTTSPLCMSVSMLSEMGWVE